MAKRKHWGRWIVLAAFVALLAIGGWWYWGRSKGSTESYRTATVDRGDLVAKVSSTGTLEPVTTVSVGTQVSGQIAGLYADYNDHVHKGQLLARLDTTVLQAAVEDAQATVDRSKAQLATAKLQFERQQNLHQQGIAPQSDLDQALEALEVAKNNLISAQTGLDRAQRNLGYATVRSPIDGVVINRLVDVGQTVAASFQAPELFQIAADLTQMQILASVDESDIGQVHTGENAEFRVQAWPDRVFKGVVQQIRLQPVTEDNVVTYTAVIGVDNSDGALLPGMTATVDFLVAEAHDVLKVANAALRFHPTPAMLEQLRQRREVAAGGEEKPETNGVATNSGRRFQGEMPGGNGSSSTSQSNRAVLWMLNAQNQFRPVAVTTGITDGQETEIQSAAVQEGTQVIIAATEGAATTLRNPFQQQNSHERRRPPGVF